METAQKNEIANEARIKELAHEAKSYFASKTFVRGGYSRASYILVGEVPSWIMELTMEAHGNSLPEDFKMEFIYEALESLEEGTETPNFEAAEDIGELTAWLGSLAGRSEYVEEMAQDYEYNVGKNGILGLLALGQLAEKQEVWNIVAGWLETHGNDIQE